MDGAVECWQVRESVQVHGGVVHTVLVTELLQVRHKPVQVLEVGGEHDHGEEWLQQQGGGEGGKLQLMAERKAARLLWREDKVRQVREVTMATE